MAIRYVIQLRSNPLKKEEDAKFYLAAKSLGSIDRKSLIEDMVRNTSLTKNEAATGIDYLFEAIPRFLALGFTVKLGELGYFKTTISCEGVDALTDATPDKVRKLRVRFIPGSLIRGFANGFHLEKYPE